MENIMKIKRAINSHKDIYGDSDSILKLDLNQEQNSIFDAGYLEGLREALRLINSKG
jgi:hypothetical protein|tara:strand:- start:342 stop:512 length:171 start_codon:yes stop_codon:yes gene_type:complete